jgi:nitroreductase
MPEIIPALSQRRARRAYDPRPLLPDEEQALWYAVSVAPSHGNTQPTRILVARSPEKREALVAALSDGNRHWAQAAPLLAALTAQPAHDTVQKNRDGSERELWPFHAGIAAGNLMTQATAMGIVAHPLAGFDEQSVRDVFGAPEELRVLAVFAIGRPGAIESLPEDLQRKEVAPQVRLPLERIVAEDRWHSGLEESARDLSRRDRG